MPAANIDDLVRRFQRDRALKKKDRANGAQSGAPVPFVDWPSFNIGVAAIITANAVTMGLETSDRMRGDNSMSSMWLLLEIFFSLFFLGELCLRIYFYRWAYFGTLGYTKHFWEIPEFATVNFGNIFDLAVVIATLIDTAILMPIGMMTDAKFLSFLRFTRLVRLVRITKIFRMRIFRDLWLVTSGLMDAMRTLVWVGVILVLLIEVCAIITTRAIGHNHELYDPYFMTSGGWDHEALFKTISRSMFTLFQVMTLDNWSNGIVRHVGKVQPGMGVFFVAFVAIINFGILNIVVGVVIEATLRTSAQDNSKQEAIAERKRLQVFAQLRQIFEEADVDGSGTLSLEEVMEQINRPEVFNKLKMIDFPVEKPEQIFSLLDYDGTGELTIDELITGCLRMKGQAKSKDLLVAQVAIDRMRNYLELFETESTKFKEKILLLTETTQALMAHGEHIFLNTREYKARHPDTSFSRKLSVPLMSDAEIEQAPWQQDDRNAVIRRSPALMLANGNRSPQPTLPPAIDTDDDGLHSAPEVTALADRPAAGMLTDGPLQSPGDELALTQLPGAMPPEGHGP